MPFGIDIKFTPLTPGIQPRSAPTLPSSPNSFKSIDEEIQQLVNLRRNTLILLDEITAWTDQGQEIAHRSQSAPLLSDPVHTMEAPMLGEADFGFLDGYDPEAMLTDEPASFELDADQLAELQRLCEDTFPSGLPGEADAWATLPEMTEVMSSELPSPAILDELESFFKTFQDVDDLLQNFDMTTSTADPIQR